MNQIITNMMTVLKSDHNFYEMEEAIRHLINHDQQLLVYRQIALKLGMIAKSDQDIVSKPTRFINQISPDDPVDVVLIDEAHLLYTQAQSVQDKHQAWAEQAHTINEIGSTYSIQGFDLNYVGVIIGPSVKYRDGKIVFDKEATSNRKASIRRTLSDGSKEFVSDTLLKNELNVLLTRGVNGLYIYAVDEALREALMEAQKINYGIYY